MDPFYTEKNEKHLQRLSDYIELQQEKTLRVVLQFIVVSPAEIPRTIQASLLTMNQLNLSDDWYSTGVNSSDFTNWVGEKHTKLLNFWQLANGTSRLVSVE